MAENKGNARYPMWYFTLGKVGGGNVELRVVKGPDVRFFILRFLGELTWSSYSNSLRMYAF